MSNKKERKRPIISGRVKELRELTGKTQEAFADIIEISANTVSRIENESMSLSSEIALKIAKEFKVSLDWLFFLSDDMESSARKAKMEEALACIEQGIEQEIYQDGSLSL